MRAPEDIASAALAQAADGIVQSYLAGLLERGNPLAQSDAALAGVRLQAESLIDEMARILKSHRQAPADLHLVSGPSWTLSRKIGEDRARARLHPRHSLLAGSELFAAIVQGVADELPADADPHLLIQIANLTNRLISDRIGAAADSYSSFLLREVQQANLTERLRMARDLHDRVGHDLHLAYRQLELLKLTRPSDPTRAELGIESTMLALRDTMESLRQVIGEMRSDTPMESLQTALQTVAESTLADSVEVTVDVNGDERWAPHAIMDEAYLIIREALRNALAHAEANSVQAVVDIAPHEMRAIIEDDGVGFDTTARSSGAGLASMRERIDLLNGEVITTSTLNRGSTVDVLIPLPGVLRDVPA